MNKTIVIGIVVAICIITFMTATNEAYAWGDCEVQLDPSFYSTLASIGQAVFENCSLPSPDGTYAIEVYQASVKGDIPLVRVENTELLGNLPPFKMFYRMGNRPIWVYLKPLIKEKTYFEMIVTTTKQYFLVNGGQCFYRSVIVGNNSYWEINSRILKEQELCEFLLGE